MEKQVLRKYLLTLTNSTLLMLTSLLIVLRTCIRIAAAPLFPGLRRFPEGRGFKQWTGDDSKALMKVCPHPLSELA